LLKLQETRIAQNIVFFGKIWYTSLMNKIMLGFIMLSLIVVNGCAFSKLAGGAIGVIETAINKQALTMVPVMGWKWNRGATVDTDKRMVK